MSAFCDTGPSRCVEESGVLIMSECEGKIKMMKLQSGKLPIVIEVKIGGRARLGAVCCPGNLSGNGYVKWVK